MIINVFKILLQDSKFSNNSFRKLNNSSFSESFNPSRSLSQSPFKASPSPSPSPPNLSRVKILVHETRLMNYKSKN